jgi:curli biogenesis system outer membrane secretion channel CsgG
MKPKNLSIAVLTMSAIVLAAAHVLVQTQPAQAEAVIKERDYQVVTAKIATGGDGLYILDNRTGQVAVFTYDPASRGVRARTVRNAADAFTVGR